MWNPLAHKKKILVVILTSFALVFAFSTTIRADIASLSDYYLLQLVETFTNPNPQKHGPIIETLLRAVTSIANLDDSEQSPTPNLQAAFRTYAKNSEQSSIDQIALQKTLFDGFFGSSPPTNAADLTYLPSLTVPPSNNYLKNASGLSLTHRLPDPEWTGGKANLANYTNFYNLSVAAQSFNAYVLSQIATDLSNKIPDSQKFLIDQSSDAAKFFTQITEESIGAVLRQILIYESQIYILLSQMLQTQKLMVATQAVNNTLIMANGIGTENLLLSKAINQP